MPCFQTDSSAFPKSTLIAADWKYNKLVKKKFNSTQRLIVKNNLGLILITEDENIHYSFIPSQQLHVQN